MKQEFIRVGRIVNAHGIRGEVRVQPRRVSPALLTRCKTFYIDGQPITPTANHVHKELVLLKLPGVDDMNAALTYKNKDCSSAGPTSFSRRGSISTMNCWGWRSMTVTPAPC